MSADLHLRKTQGNPAALSRTAAALVLALVLSGAHDARAEDVLRWTNGNNLVGELVRADAKQITWSSPFFTEPVSIGLHELRRMESPSPDKKPDEPCSIRLSDGSRIYGDLVAADDATVTIQSKRHGKMVLFRHAIVSVRRLAGGRLTFAGPTSGAGWDDPNPKAGKSKSGSLWRETAGGALTQIGFSRSSFLPLAIGPRTELEISLRSTVRPEFKLELVSNNGKKLLVETWDDELVLQGRKFVSLRTLTADDHSIHLRLFWDRDAGQTAVYLSTGEKLAESKKAAVGASTSARVGSAERESGITLRNKGPSLTLDSLRLRSWDGELPTDARIVRPRVVLMDGTVIAGRIAGGAGGKFTVSPPPGKGAARTVSWSDVEVVEFTNEQDLTFTYPSAELWFSDGTWIAGQFLHVKGGRVALHSSLSSDPLISKVAGLRRIEFRVPPPPNTPPSLPINQLDKLTIGKKILRGTLESASTGLRWKPVGASQSVALAPVSEIEVTRGTAPGATFPKAPALFYLEDGDIVPGKLRSIDKASVSLESDVVTQTEIPVSRLRSIQFFQDAVNLDGLEDPGWQRVKGDNKKVKVDGGKVQIEPGGAFGHPSILQGDQLRFSFGGDRYGYGGLRVRLFCNSLENDSSSINMIFFRYSDEIVFGVETFGGNIDSQNRMGVKPGPVPIRIGLKEKEIEIFLNNVSARKIPIKASKRAGLGLIFEPGSLWGNDPRTAHLAGISVRAAAGIVNMPGVNKEAKKHALTVPRFRKEDPPRHVLVAANGDLLRGAIEAATADHFAVRSGFEIIRVPRERVAAAIWLKKAEEDDESEKGKMGEKESADGETHAAGRMHWLLLSNGARLGFAVDEFGDGFVAGRHPLLGRCRVPITDVHVIRASAPAPNIAMQQFDDWQLTFAPEPVLPETGGQSSPLLGKAAPEFKLPLLAGSDFELSKAKGSVVVLDFWATWCGPCIKAIPEYIESMSEFDRSRVRFIGVNQAEGVEPVKRFLETRGWEMEVALDSQQRVGQKFGVEGIPHTVIVGPDGKVAWVKTGYDPAGAAEAAAAVRRLLDGEAE